MIGLLLKHGRDGDVAQLTGARQRQRQIEALARMKIPFRVAPDGWPRVLYVDITDPDRARSAEPDWNALKAIRS